MTIPPRLAAPPGPASAPVVSAGNPADALRRERENAARYLDGRMREIRNGGRAIGGERIAVLAALNIAYELLQLRTGSEAPQDDTRTRVRELLDKVERALQEPLEAEAAEAPVPAVRSL